MFSKLFLLLACLADGAAFLTPLELGFGLLIVAQMLVLLSFFAYSLAVEGIKDEVVRDNH